MKKTKKTKLTDQQIKEKLRKKCVLMAKEISKTKDGRLCQYCKIPGRVVHSHHIFSEGLNKGMSADPDNLITLCWLHHLGGLKFVSTRNFSFHGSPSDATEWLKEIYPDRYLALKIRSRKSVQCDLFYWKRRYIILEQELKELLEK